MKKIIIFIIILIPIYTKAISADAYIVMDANTNRVLDGKNINKEHLIASTTKIMTAIIIIENVNLNEEVEVSDVILKSYGSSMYLNVGEKLRVIDLLYGLLLRSGNDAAIMLANYYSGSMEAFSVVMNNYAKKLGMNHTTFINSSGLENDAGIGNISTAYDMAILESYAINNNIYNKISGTKYYNFKSSNKSFSMKNKNKLLFETNYVIGGKTGYTKKARRTLVSAGIKDNKKVIVVTLNDPNDFNDHKTLYQKVFKNYQIKNVCENIHSIKDPLNLYDGYEFNYDEECNLLLNKDEIKSLKIDYVLFDNHSKKNHIAGIIKFKINNNIIYQSLIRLKKKVKWYHYLQCLFNGC
ncbi:MAG: D-alanyl-D-alanine carboxypeptidase [Bacilli bacterium]|nr:D-alanyl-D-alanine carboxypeptidase [Bacilli bacterium]